MPYTPCPLCPRQTAPILEAIPDSRQRIIFVGEGPAREEHNKGFPFAGKTGKEYDQQYLPIAGLARFEVYTSNTCKCIEGRTRVKFTDGTSLPISHVVKHRIDKPVLSVDSNGVAVHGKIKRWLRSERAGRQLYRFWHKHQSNRGSGKPFSVATGDHEVLTNRGWIPLDQTVSGDKIHTGTRGLSIRQLGFLTGMLLGDSYLDSSSVTLCHKACNEDYLELKSSVLGIPGTKYLVSNKYSDEYGWCWRSSRLPFWRWVRSSFGTRKYPNLEFLENYFDEASLAMWYFDDGSLRGNSSYEICCTRLDQDTVNFLVDLIFRKTGVIVHQTSKRGRLFVSAKQAPRMTEILRRYCPESMRYKIAVGHASTRAEAYEPDYCPFFDDLIVEKNNGTPGTVYCLEIEEYANFCVTSGVVHNCPTLPDYSNPPLELAKHCSQHWLRYELPTIYPEIMVVMGAIALHSLFPGHDLGLEHGIPFYGELIDHTACRPMWEGWVFPTMHPASGLYDNKYLGLVQEDFKRLRRWLDAGGNFEYEDEIPAKKTRLTVIEDLNTLTRELGLAAPGGRVALDTETKPDYSPYCSSFSVEPASGHVVKDQRLMDYLWDWIISTESLIILHNKLFDNRVLRELGLDIDGDGLQYRDTIISAFHLGFLPQEQGLKSLSFRLLHHRMLEFEEVVFPASRPHVVDWVNKLDREIEDYIASEYKLPFVEGDLDTTIKRPKPLTAKKAGQLNRKWLRGQTGFKEIDLSQRQVRKWVKKLGLEDDYYPWKHIQGYRSFPLFEDLSGRLPPPSIEYLDDVTLANYAGNDPRQTLRLDTVLEQMKRGEEMEVNGWDEVCA